MVSDFDWHAALEYQCGIWQELNWDRIAMTNQLMMEACSTLNVMVDNYCCLLARHQLDGPPTNFVRAVQNYYNLRHILVRSRQALTGLDMAGSNPAVSPKIDKRLEEANTA